MTKQKILIGGCSFSEYQCIPPTRPRTWDSWTDFLYKDYNYNFDIVNRGQSSFGQSKIVETLIDELVKNKFQVDLVLVQWSGVGRGYAMTEQEFVERIYKQKELFFAPHMHEYLASGNLDQHDPTNISKIASKQFYRSSLTQIFLMKNILLKYNIPYKMFWGWEQITPEIEKDNKDLLDLIYDENFIRFGNHGGMSEMIVDKLGKAGIIPNDFHPTTAGQKYFYDTVIKEIINDRK